MSHDASKRARERLCGMPGNPGQFHPTQKLDPPDLNRERTV